MDGEKGKIDLKLAADLYNHRFADFGRNIKTVGWGSAEDQKLRFEMLFRNLYPKGKTILDVGCGLGDLVPYLSEITNRDFKYIGIDIAENLIKDARKTYKGKNILFYVGDIFSVQVPHVDYAVLSGALSFKQEGIEVYAINTMKRMFELSNEVASLNFLSKYVDFEAEKNQHYLPEEIFKKAKQLSKRVNIFHDYPLYEFTIQILKS